MELEADEDVLDQMGCDLVVPLVHSLGCIPTPRINRRDIILNR